MSSNLHLLKSLLAPRHRALRGDVDRRQGARLRRAEIVPTETTDPRRTAVGRAAWLAEPASRS